jgi:hypothetical protein
MRKTESTLSREFKRDQPLKDLPKTEEVMAMIRESQLAYAETAKNEIKKMLAEWLKRDDLSLRVMITGFIECG